MDGGEVVLVQLLNNLINRVGIILLLAFFLSRIGLFKKLVIKKNVDLKDKILLAIIFGSFGIIGTYTGIHIQGAIANSRVIGVFVGGLLGGPLVGILSGIIAGGHRFLIDIGGFTATACALSTFTEGLMAGLLKRKIENSQYRFVFAMIAGFVAEIGQMIIILLVAKPLADAWNLVVTIGIPMILANGIGIAIFIAITDSILLGIENEAAFQAKLALKIADKTLLYFRKGFNEETATSIAQIIKDMTDFNAVAFTDNNKILAHVGLGEDHHLHGTSIMTNLTREVLDKGKYVVANTKDEIACDDESCSLKSAIIVPLIQEDKVIGVLKLYKDKKHAISKSEIELALGLAQLFSTQIELSKIDYQRELLSKSELRALQAQINPHFLFNAINTIVSFTRTQPDNARRLLINLGDFFRANLQVELDEVDLTKEIEHINSYVEIEKARFGDKLQVKYNIQESVSCKLPPLLLQPLVENAIKHGIFDKVEGGIVEVIARDHPGFTKIDIIDNGIGMSKELLSCLFNKDKNRDCIGLINIDERLKNIYGHQYGLDIISELGKGTTVTLIIPKPERMVVI